jgi:hypothetical protein
LDELHIRPVSLRNPVQQHPDALKLSKMENGIFNQGKATLSHLKVLLNASL